MKRRIIAMLVCTAGIAAAGFSQGALAQASGIKRDIVKKSDVSIPGYETVVARVEVAPGILAGRHTHPGEEISYVIEGEGEVLFDDEPPLKIKSGDAFVIPAGKTHDAKNTGSGPFRLVVVYVVEKGKPLASPAATK